MVIKACEDVPGFKAVETRYLDEEPNGPADVVVVDSTNDAVPTRNVFNIKVRERLALVFPQDTERGPQVRALRSDFPLVPHLNHVRTGEPSCLCIYAEPWTVTQRTWTPQKFLQRISQWFSETSKGTLHTSEQPLEPIWFLDSLFDLVLSPDFDEKVQREEFKLNLHAIRPSEKDQRVTFRTSFSPRTSQQEPEQISQIQIGFPLLQVAIPKRNIHIGQTILEARLPHHGPDQVSWVPIGLRVSKPAIHGRIECFPKTLGDVESLLKKHESTMINDLREAVLETTKGGVVHSENEYCVLMISVPMKRSTDSIPENTHAFGFILETSLAALGRQLGVLHVDSYSRYFPAKTIGEPSFSDDGSWMNISISPVSMSPMVTAGFARRASGIFSETAEFEGILAGVGSLGSVLIEIWSKASWGSWTLIDPDVFKSHNVVRHIAKDCLIGRSKVDAVEFVVKANYHPDYYSVRAIADTAATERNVEFNEALQKSKLLVDATTTIDVPRDLAGRSGSPRMTSVFLTPSGRDSVLLLEDADKRIRLDSLEAQYYRAILNSDWGKEHLVGHKGELWVGAGCRDVSMVMSYGTVQLHGAIIAEQLRKMRDCEEPRICVWSTTPESAVQFNKIEVENSRETNGGSWRVLWDDGIHKRLRKLRHEGLPNETGGIILGYTDHKTSTIAIVDVMPAPPDSLASEGSFIRGTENLKADIENAKRRTAHIVGYVGEWHSHPPFISPNPSRYDEVLLTTLRQELKRDGEPALMLIVGTDGEVSVHVDSVAKN